MTAGREQRLAEIRGEECAHYSWCSALDARTFGVDEGQCDCQATPNIVWLLAEVDRLRAERAEMLSVLDGAACVLEEWHGGLSPECPCVVCQLRRAAGVEEAPDDRP